MPHSALRHRHRDERLQHRLDDRVDARIAGLLDEIGAVVEVLRELREGSREREEVNGG